MKFEDKLGCSIFFEIWAPLRLDRVAETEKFVVEENRVTDETTLIHSVASCLLLLVLGVPLVGCAGKTRPTTPEAAHAELRRGGIDYSPERFVQSAKEGNSKIIELFLAAGMDPDASDGSGKTALMQAAERAMKRLWRCC
jgi:hypothetical protein